MKKNLFNILIVLFLVSSINLKKIRIRQDFDAKINELLNAGLIAWAIFDEDLKVLKTKNINLSEGVLQTFVACKYFN